MNNGEKPAHPTGMAQSGTGITKLEHFAGLAMQGLLANSDISQLFKGNNGEPVTHVVAEVSVRLSDALLAELDKK